MWIPKPAFGADGAETITDQASRPGYQLARTAVAALFERFDCDHDAAIDPGEVDEHFTQVWAPADLDRSRLLSPQEFRNTHSAMRAADAELLFAHADRNGDGAVDADELRRHLRELIEVLDTDNDWEITRADAGLPPLRVIPATRPPQP